MSRSLASSLIPESLSKSAQVPKKIPDSRHVTLSSVMHLVSLGVDALKLNATIQLCVLS